MTHLARGRSRLLVAVSTALLLGGCDAGPGAARAGDAALAEPAPVAVPAADAAGRSDWKGLAYEVLDCTSRAGWVATGLPAAAWDDETVRSSVADVTGDGADEVLVEATCPSPTSTPAGRVVVLDVTGAEPAVLGVLGGELFLPELTVTTAGSTVTLSGPTVAGTDPTCCPGHLGTVTYAWDGARFVVRTLDEVPASR